MAVDVQVQTSALHVLQMQWQISQQLQQVQLLAMRSMPHFSALAELGAVMSIYLSGQT